MNTPDIAALVLQHYDIHARSLPWRSPPGEPPQEAYRVWLSEIMLQQTTVTAVIPYYLKFLARWPTLADLAVAEDADLMAAWAGLGYYSRARNLLACARLLMAEHAGAFPETSAELERLPGIGPYTAAAIAAIAFGEQAAVLDANVERVISRLYAINTPLPAAKPAMREKLRAITPPIRPGDFAQAMMDLGASLCSVKSPNCLACPLQDHCAAYVAGDMTSYPVKPPKKSRPDRKGLAYYIKCEGHVWIVQRPEVGMLAAMAALPDDGWSAQRDGSGELPFAADWQFLPTPVSHIFTHARLELFVAVTSLPVNSPAPKGRGRWVAEELLEDAGLPTLYTKAVKAVAKHQRTQDKANY